MSVNGLSMMKRQLLRVKQIADQTFQRNEKTEVLTDELLLAERKVELIKQACQNSGKKLSSCMQRLAAAAAETSSTSERRSPKKCPEAVLAQCMEQWGLNLGEGSILGLTLVDCARIQDVLASDLLAYKYTVEDSVVHPLQNILRVDIDNVTKCRKQLAKFTAEMDAAKLRHQTAVKNCQQVSNNGLASAVSRADVLKEEAEDAATKVDQCRDVLAAEMFSLISRESELARLFVKYCQLQMEYHRAAFSVLESSLPELEAQISNCSRHPVFGIPLEDHLQYCNREIAIVIERCICWLLDNAMDEEGLFRIGGSVTKIKKIKSAFDAGVTHIIDDEKDPHNIAGVLKLYLRSLPEPLLTFDLHDDWMKAARIQDHDAQLQALWTVVHSLPDENFKNLKYLTKFLSHLTHNSEANKMSSQNIAIVMGPTLLWSPVDENVLGMNMTATNTYSLIARALVMYADWFFPGESNFHISGPTSHYLSTFVAPSEDLQLCLSAGKTEREDSAINSLSSSPTNSPTSPKPGVPLQTEKEATDLLDLQNNLSHTITRSLSHGTLQQSSSRQTSSGKIFQANTSDEKLLFCLESVATSQDSISVIANSKNVCYRNETKIGTVGCNSVPVIKPSRTKNKSKSLPKFVDKPNEVEKSSSLKASSLNETDSVNPTRQNVSKNGFVDIRDVNITFHTREKNHDVSPMSFMDDSDLEEERPVNHKITENNMQTSVNSNAQIEFKVSTRTGISRSYCENDRKEPNSLQFDALARKVSSKSESSVFVGSQNYGKATSSMITRQQQNENAFLHTPYSQLCSEITGCDTYAKSMEETEEKFKPSCGISSSCDEKVKLTVNSVVQNTRL